MAGPWMRRGTAGLVTKHSRLNCENSCLGIGAGAACWGFEESGFGNCWMVDVLVIALGSTVCNTRLGVLDANTIVISKTVVGLLELVCFCLSLTTAYLRHENI
jgi:hypothetical protein